MSENDTTTTVTPSVEDLADVEGHGLREVAAGLTVTAAVIGAAGAASAAVIDRPSVGGTAATATQAVDATLRGTGLATGNAIAQQLRPTSSQLVTTGRTADATVAATERTALATVSDATDVDDVVAAAGRLVDATGKALGDALSFLKRTVDRKVAETRTTVDETRETAEQVADTAAGTATSTVREAGHDAQAATESAADTAGALPGQAMDTAISTLQETKETWEQAVADLTVPDAAGAVDTAADTVDAALEGIDPRELVALS
ncbi:MAG: hypothetical protein Q8R60_11570 [Mycobacteriales bacterium]|nr:hypothetical protein [Mycobacteriales bacterium]